MAKIENLTNKTQLTPKGFSLDDIMYIDDVRYIKDVGEVLTNNGFARQILMDLQLPAGLDVSSALKGLVNPHKPLP